jgi:organic hydroperoxide reductase OsmC/OhrA
MTLFVMSHGFAQHMAESLEGFREFSLSFPAEATPRGGLEAQPPEELLKLER